MLLVALCDLVESHLTGECVGQFSPRGLGSHAVPHIATVRRIGVVTIEGCDTHRPARNQRRIDELLRLSNPLHPVRRVSQRDQSVRLPAPVRCVESEDRRHLPTGTGQPAAYVGKEILQAACRIRVGKEPCWIGVVGVRGATLVRKNTGQVRRKLGFGHPPLKDVGSRRAEIEDGRDVHLATLSSDQRRDRIVSDPAPTAAPIRLSEHIHIQTVGPTAPADRAGRGRQRLLRRSVRAGVQAGFRADRRSLDMRHDPFDQAPHGFRLSPY